MAEKKGTPQYKSIKVRTIDFVRFKDRAHKEGQKLMDLFGSLIS